MPAPKGHPPYPGCETGGRPLYWNEERLDEMADKLVEWSLIDSNIFIEEFCGKVYQTHSDKVFEWADRSDKFRSALKFNKQMQEIKLIKGGLTRKFSDSFTKFLLINNFGIRKYAEKTETLISGDAANPLSVMFNHSKNLLDKGEIYDEIDHQALLEQIDCVQAVEQPHSEIDSQ